MDKCSADVTDTDNIMNTDKNTDKNTAKNTDKNTDKNNHGNNKMEKLWPQVRKLLVFQIKLYIDAFRDLLLSALSLGAFLIDLLQRNEGPDSYFERVLKFGRHTEHAINLFNQFDAGQHDEHSVDSLLNEVEDKIRKNVKGRRE